MEEKDSAKTEATAGGYKVLLVDDDDFMIDMYCRKFTQSGDEVRSASNVNEGLELLRSGFKPDAVVFDLAMPGKTGIDFLTAVREEKLAAGTVMVALTNQWEAQHKEKVESLGADGYIIKAEVVPSEIMKKVHELILAKHGREPRSPQR